MLARSARAFMPEWLSLFAPQSRFGGELLRIRLVCPQNGTALLKGLNV